MPYIPQERRAELDSGRSTPTSCGELSYQVTQLCTRYATEFSSRLTYGTLNNVIGALECAKLEFYRRMVAPFEDTKLVENGDVY